MANYKINIEILYVLLEYFSKILEYLEYFSKVLEYFSKSISVTSEYSVFQSILVIRVFQ